MTHSIFEGCSDGCGWVAALVATLSFGSYGVSIKESSKKNVEAHPLVLQSYKVLVFFLSSFLVPWIGVDIRWTNWGLVSSALWNFGATLGIYAVMLAGMATSEGTWSSVIVLVNFVFGILVFHEGVKSFADTCFSFFLITAGLIGMSLYSSPQPQEQEKQVNQPMIEAATNQSEENNVKKSRQKGLRQRQASSDDENYDEEAVPVEPFDKAGEKGPKENFLLSLPAMGSSSLILSRRDLGIIAAAINGFCGGTSLVPMHYAAEEGFGGARYYFSFAAGSMLVISAVWVVLFAYRMAENQGNFVAAVASLPKWHFKELWFPGFLSGALFSVGEFSSVIAVTYLGQGVGNTFVQCKIMVAGFWGLLYYREITGFSMVGKWFLSASFALVGILVLSHEHEHLPHH